ncbi:MAG: penicillin acylase family protein, partial [Gemmatimonadota bacterium]
MKSSRLGDVLAGAILAGLLALSVRRTGSLPALGPFLDPANGVWSVARQADLPAAASAVVPGLLGPVRIRYDQRAVPHIFAASEADVIRALGYVVARDRLLQIELQWRAGAGRLTEFAGRSLLPIDRESRGLGLADAAEVRIASLAADSRERRLLEAFSDGVNAWIDRLGPRDVPLEYHLLGRRPARWSPVNSLYLLGRMGWTLALSDLEERRESAAALVGAAAADALYPVNSPIQEPIQPNGQHVPREDFVRLPPPSKPTLATVTPTGSRDAEPELRRGTADDDGRSLDALGSNNWAVAPARTRDGYALLAGDPHLELSLPSIWYEAHLVVPDSLDVYGVTIPGAPGITIGFTRDVAWTFTNAEADVLDQYEEVVDDSTTPVRYRVDGAWRALRIVAQRYRDPSGAVIAVDTLRYTHRGPLSKDRSGRWISMRWTVLEAGHELAAFAKAARARTAAGWLDSIASYAAPAQNMLVADRAGTIAIRTTGRFPIRPGSGRGDLLQRGDTSASDWVGDWSLAALPQAINPAQGYLASANQQPIDPRANPRYLGANWYTPARAIRINELLRADSAVTPDAMRRFQTDPGSPLADRLVPAFLAAARRFPMRDSLQRAATLLAEWDRRYTRDNVRAVLYEEATRQLTPLLWDELEFGRPGLPRPATPGMAIVLELLRDSTSAWWDDQRTPRVMEDRDAILAEALVRALHETVREHGEPDAGGWRWEKIRHANIYHLLRLPALSALGVPVQGGMSTLNPSSGNGSFGPSWRMVVELGPEVRGWGIYPGGQSGNPSSSRYLDRL